MIRMNLSPRTSDLPQHHDGKARDVVGPFTVVDVVGDVDAFRLKQVTATMKSAIKQGTDAVIVSFEHAGFFESSLLRELMKLGHALLIGVECFESRAQALKSTPYAGPSRASAIARLQSWA